MRSIDPWCREILRHWTPHAPAEVEALVASAVDAQVSWRRLSFDARAVPLRRIAALLREREERYGRLMTREMGKPIEQARAEIRKCAVVCDHYAEHAAALLAHEPVDVGDEGAMLRFDPLGVVLSIMPWNFPWWQVLRFAAPALMAGNAVLVKHAENTLGCGEAIAQLVLEAGLPEGLLQHVIVEVDRIPPLIADPRIAAVTLTGSDRAGRAVASAAGSSLKRTVLELGGSDPFIVLEDADLDMAVRGAIAGRTQNSGQSCVAAKRFVVLRDVAEPFIERFAAALADLRVGDPRRDDTDIGPLARPDLLATLADQVDASVAAGARVMVGGAPDGPCYPPTLLVDVPTHSPAAREELFGPVAAVFVVDDEESAVALANDTRFGLAASIWTRDLPRAQRIAARLETGGVFVNRIPISDPRHPFGGIRDSGYGRELGREGIREFVNVKTVRWVR